MITFLTAALLLAQPATAASDTTPEAPAITLTIDGVPHPVQPGRTTTITIDGRDHEVRVDLPTTALFAGDFVRFHYPTSAASVIREKRDGYFVTRIAVKDAFISLYEFPSLIGLDVMFDSIVSQFAQVEHETGDVQLQTNTAKLEGRFVVVNVAGAWVRQEMYRVSNGTASTFIILQDGRDEADVPTPEFTHLTSEFARTFSVK